MFKKLKERISEEVKSSPQRLQQITQSVSDRLQTTTSPNTSTNSTVVDNSFFSITDDGDNTVATDEAGYTNVSLSALNGAVPLSATLWPPYEPQPYQTVRFSSDSDLDEGASTASTAQLGNLSKQQLLDAYRKCQQRYHKYRGRYNDLDRHCSDLERDRKKIHQILVETQDKAIRRISELKEQCGLEQKAKAHLEGALRDELDERQMKIDSLQSTVDLLRAGGGECAHLKEQLAQTEGENTVLNEKINELKASLICFQSRNTKLDNENLPSTESDKYHVLEMNHLELIEDCSRQRAQIEQLERDLCATQFAQDKIERLTATIDTLQGELDKRQVTATNEFDSVSDERHLLLIEKIAHIKNDLKQIDLDFVIDVEDMLMNHVTANHPKSNRLQTDFEQIEECEKCAHFQIDLVELRRTNDDLNRNLIETSASLQTSELTNRELRNEIDLMTNTKTQLETNREHELIHLRDEIDQLTDRLNRLQIEKDELQMMYKKKIDDFEVNHQRQLNESKLQLEHTINEKLTCEKQCEKTSEKCTELELQTNELKRNFNEKSQENVQLWKRLEAILNEKETNDRQQNTILEQCSEFQMRLKQLTSDNNYLTEQNHKLEMVKVENSEREENLKITIDKQLEQMERLQDDYGKLVEDNRYLRNVNRSYAEKSTQCESMNNRTSEFYEKELKKVYVENEHLSRQLSDTLVTLNHCAELSSMSTEIEYLRNILYNYMVGKESLILAKVIAAVCKFNEKQTDEILQKEQQRQTLLGQLGIL